LPLAEIQENEYERENDKHKKVGWEGTEGIWRLTPDSIPDLSSTPNPPPLTLVVGSNFIRKAALFMAPLLDTSSLTGKCCMQFIWFFTSISLFVGSSGDNSFQLVLCLGELVILHTTEH
jgi:hypothetical protein